MPRSSPSRHQTVTLIDLDTGNLRSVVNAFGRVGADVVVARTPSEAEGASAIVLPGVGAFERASDRLRRQGFDQFLREHCVSFRRPLLGICLGMQLLAERSYEHGSHEGLGLIAGEVLRLDARPPDDRVPNIGWVSVRARRESVLFPEAGRRQSFYHVHSYHMVCGDPADTVGTFEFGGGEVVTAVERENVFGVQFHPEKSQDAGLDLIDRWLSHWQVAREAET